MNAKISVYYFLILMVFPLTACFSSDNKAQSEKPLATESTKPEFIYVYDPLCGWCYGFSPVMQKLKDYYKDKMNFTIYSGGLVVGERVSSIKEGFGFIKAGTKTVTKTTGVEFGKPFMDLVEEGSYIYNSEPACVALTVFKTINPERAFEFAHDMQLALFKAGKSLNDTATFLNLVKNFDVNPDDFLQKFRQEEYKKATYEEFETANALGADGFPTVIIKKGNDYKVLSNGYKDYDELRREIDKTLK